MARGDEADEEGMSSAGDEGDAGLDALGVADERGEEVAFEVIDGEEWFVAGEGEGFGGRGADEEGAGEAGSGGGGEGVDVGELEAGVGEDGFGDGPESGHVVAGGQFRDDAAVGLVFRDLGGDAGGEDVAVGIADGGGGFVARGFDRKDDGVGWHGWGRREETAGVGGLQGRVP